MPKRVVGGRWTRASGLTAALVVACSWAAGCSVVPLPVSFAERGQQTREHYWDVSNCAAEASYQTGYNPSDSPMANWFQKMFFWGTAGAALGGLITGIPSTICGPATDGLIAGAGAGGIAGTVQSLSGHERFERAWTACMQAHGYTVAPRAAAERPSPDARGEADVARFEPLRLR